jgi:group I intron endonuclease
MVTKKIIKGVYCLTFPNGKRYVGISFGKKGILNRWKGEALEAKRPKNNSKLANAIRKYGWENVNKEIIIIIDDEKRMKNIETQLIALWNLQNDNYGYNMTAGGDGCKNVIPWNKGKEHSPETRKKISVANKGKGIGRKSWNKGLPAYNRGISPSDEIRKKISVANKGKRNKFLTEYNKNPGIWTKERRDKVARKGISNGRAKIRTVVNIKTGQTITGCLTQIARDINLNPDSFRTGIVKTKRFLDWKLIDGNNDPS